MFPSDLPHAEEEGDAMSAPYCKDRDNEAQLIVDDLPALPPWDSLYGRFREKNAAIFQSDDGRMLHIYPSDGGYLAIETAKLLGDLAPFSD
jgi:hypothetical protein